MSERGVGWPASAMGSPAAGFPPPPTLTPTTERPAPTRSWYALAGIMAVVGVLAAASAVSSMLQFGGVVADFDRVDVPGQAELALDAGDYVVYYEAPGGGAMPPLELAIVGTHGSGPVELRRPTGSFDYQVSGFDGSSVWEFTVDEPGLHHVEVSAEERFGQLAIGHSMVGGLLRTVMSILGGVAALFLALVVTVVTAVRRSRHRRHALAHPAAYAHPTAPPAAW